MRQAVTKAATPNDPDSQNLHSQRTATGPNINLHTVHGDSYAS